MTELHRGHPLQFFSRLRKFIAFCRYVRNSKRAEMVDNIPQEIATRPSIFFINIVTYRIIFLFVSFCVILLRLVTSISPVTRREYGIFWLCRSM